MSRIGQARAYIATVRDTQSSSSSSSLYGFNRHRRDVEDILDSQNPHQNIINGVVNEMSSPFFRLTNKIKKPTVKQLVSLLVAAGCSETVIKSEKTWKDKAVLVMKWLRWDQLNSTPSSHFQDHLVNHYVTQWSLSQHPSQLPVSNLSSVFGDDETQV